ncbi:MAG: thioredoxin fold domain-containing protein [Candidatus Firestonebacteria bacterium]
MKRIFVVIIMLLSSQAGLFAQQKGKFTLIELVTSSCPWCVKMAPVINNIRADFSGILNVEIKNVNSDKTLAKKYKIQGVPTQVLLDEKGNVVFNHPGYCDEAKLKQMLENAGVKVIPVNPLEKVKALGVPFYKEKGKVRFIGLPSGKLEAIVTDNKGKKIRALDTKSEVLWNLKDSNGNYVAAGEYIISFSDSKDNKKDVNIKVEEKKQP